MAADAKKLREELTRAGLSSAAIEAAWPRWWSDEASGSPSARAELRFAVARSLGLSARALIGERVEFVWRDTARFKHLADGDEAARAALNSFGVSVGRTLLRATRGGSSLEGAAASDLRDVLLVDGGRADLLGLLSACWAVGLPVAHLTVSPLPRKSMHAMVVKRGGRHAVLLSREARYPALVAFTLAHEIGHVALGHLRTSDMLVDAESPIGAAGDDDEEAAADRYALELLLGDADPEIRINFDSFNAAELADAVLRAGPEYGIEPGTLALAVAYQRGAWPVAMAAMRVIYPAAAPVGQAVNRLAERELDFGALDGDGADFLRRVLGLDDA